MLHIAIAWFPLSALEKLLRSFKHRLACRMQPQETVHIGPVAASPNRQPSSQQVGQDGYRDGRSALATGLRPSRQPLQ